MSIKGRKNILGQKVSPVVEGYSCGRPVMLVSTSGIKSLTVVRADRHVYGQRGREAVYFFSVSTVTSYNEGSSTF